MNKLTLFILTIVLFFSAQFNAQKQDTVFYKKSPIIVHYNNTNQVAFYERSMFMKKDSLWKKTFYSRGKIKKKEI